MEKLSNKRYATFDYISRYTGVPYYYDNVKKKDVCGIGQQVRLDTAYVSHKVSASDTLDYLALKYYNNPTYWWIIAYFNRITDPFISLPDHFATLKIPNMASVVFSDPRS